MPLTPAQRIAFIEYLWEKEKDNIEREATIEDDLVNKITSRPDKFVNWNEDDKNRAISKRNRIDNLLKIMGRR